tara:strand:+ start:2089 stop:3216 length:1128 start_codon:yes stop_codon:yes gene_type:complete
MLFKDVIGNFKAKNSLLKAIDQKRISHSMLFFGAIGSGTLALAIAFARLVLCQDKPETSSCHIKASKFQHPDLHFVYPVAQTQNVKGKVISESFISEWRAFLSKKPYGNLLEWYEKIGIENKQGKIGKDEANEIIKKINLKSYEGGWKCVLIWMAETMNASATNKLLKIVEEPPEKTLLLFVSERTDNILETLLSRCQKVEVLTPTNAEIEKALVEKGYTNSESKKISVYCGGNYSLALSLAKGDYLYSDLEIYFQKWMRLAFNVKTRRGSLLELIEWSKSISKLGREVQKSFLLYSIETIRQAFLTNKGLPQLTTVEKKSEFNFDRFSKYITQNNISEIYSELEKACFHIESNGNPNIVFSDLSLKLTRLIHKG